MQLGIRMLQHESRFLFVFTLQLKRRYIDFDSSHRLLVYSSVCARKGGLP